MPLKFLWFFDSKPVSAEGRMLLNAGDVYFMSDKAVGYDWLTKKVLTLRHAAGAEKYSSVDTLKVFSKGTARKPPVMHLLNLGASASNTATSPSSSSYTSNDPACASTDASASTTNAEASTESSGGFNAPTIAAAASVTASDAPIAAPSATCAICQELCIGDACSPRDRSTEGSWGYAGVCCNQPFHYECVGKWIKETADYACQKRGAPRVDTVCPLCTRKWPASIGRILQA